MPDDSPAAPPHQALAAFTPVPRAKDRSNGWNAQVQRAFIEALADTGSVRAAARAVGRSEVGAYQLRRHPQGAGFAAAWDAALAHGIRRIEDVAMDRALNGVEVPVYSYGKLVGTRTRYNDRLLMFMLRNRAPDRFAGGGGARALSALDKAQLERLRAEWLREYLAQSKRDEHAAVQALSERIERMHRTWYGNMSPRARAAYRAFRRIEREDGVDWMIEGEAGESPEAAAAEYDETFAGDGRAKIKLKMESEGWFVDDVLAEDDQPPAPNAEPPSEPPPQPPRPTPRIRTLKDRWD